MIEAEESQIITMPTYCTLLFAVLISRLFQSFCHIQYACDKSLPTNCQLSQPHKLISQVF